MPATATLSPTSFELRIPKPKVLTMKEDLSFLRSAFARNPGSLDLMRRLVSMLVQLDHFDEAVELLNSNPVPDFGMSRMLVNAQLGYETTENTLLAREAAHQALRLAPTPAYRALALADLAKTHTRMGELAEAERLLGEALELDPLDKDAYKRLFRLYLDRDPERALAFANEWISRDILHARVLGSVPMALSKLGRFAEAHTAEAFDEYSLKTFPAAPSGWASREAFNAALAEEILHHPDTRYQRYGTASIRSWRVDEPALERTRVFPQLQQLIRSEVLAHVERISESAPENAHPLLRGRPAEAMLRNWCVVTEGEGHESWHVHQNGWMSGVYYIHVQDHIAQGTGPEGCIAFGMSEEFVGDDVAAAYGEHLVRPQTGLMMMFPSHSWHRTYPHQGDGHRICFAFDIIPQAN